MGIQASSTCSGPGSCGPIPMASTTNQPPTNQIDPNTGNVADQVTTPGTTPCFRTNPRTILDRAFANANLGYRQYRTMSRNLDKVGSSCSLNATVNLGNGNVIVQVAPPLGGPFDTLPVLTYNSRAEEQTSFGYGWTSILSQRVSIVGTGTPPPQADLIDGTRLTWSYTSPSGTGPTTYTPPNGSNNTSAPERRR